MHTVSVKYDLIWQFADSPHYKVTRCRKVFNTKTGTQIKMVLNGGSIGFWIKSKFIPISRINDLIEKIPVSSVPF